MNDFESTIRQLEQMRTSIDRALTALQGMPGQGDNSHQPLTVPQLPKAGKRRLSAEGRRRIAEAARKRWAAFHKTAGTVKRSAAKPRKRRLSPEGRKRIIEAAKRRWAANRAADAAAKPKRARKAA